MKQLGSVDDYDIITLTTAAVLCPFKNFPMKCIISLVLYHTDAPYGRRLWKQ